MKKSPLNTNPGSSDWEAVCQRCGRCCYEKIEHRGRIYHIDQPCKYLNTETKLCRVYDRRDKQQVDCVRLTPELVVAGFLPQDCPYVAGLKSHQLQDAVED